MQPAENEGFGCLLRDRGSGCDRVKRLRLLTGIQRKLKLLLLGQVLRADDLSIGVSLLVVL